MDTTRDGEVAAPKVPWQPIAAVVALLVAVSMTVGALLAGAYTPYPIRALLAWWYIRGVGSPAWWRLGLFSALQWALLIAFARTGEVEWRLGGIFAALDVIGVVVAAGGAFGVRRRATRPS